MQNAPHRPGMPLFSLCLTHALSAPRRCGPTRPSFYAPVARISYDRLLATAPVLYIYENKIFAAAISHRLHSQFTVRAPAELFSLVTSGRRVTVRRDVPHIPVTPAFSRINVFPATGPDPLSSSRIASSSIQSHRTLPFASPPYILKRTTNYLRRPLPPSRFLSATPLSRCHASPI